MGKILFFHSLNTAVGSNSEAYSDNRVFNVVAITNIKINPA